MKKGYAILMDSILALSMILILAYGLTSTRYISVDPSQAFFEKSHYSVEDAMDVLNKKGVLDQVGEYWAAADGNFSSEEFQNATNLTRDYLDMILPPYMGYRLIVDDDIVIDEPRNVSEDGARAKTHASRLLVGYASGLPTRGNVARAFLNAIKAKSTNIYTYFGGHVGMGNITVYSTEIPLDAHILDAWLELQAGSDFKLLVNGVDLGDFSINSSAGDMNVNINEQIPGYGNFTGGRNKIEFLFDDANFSRHYLGGGYLRISYNTSEMDTDTPEGIDRYLFPGINGSIDVYDSFFVPGYLNNMTINLMYQSNESIFLNVGGVTVYNSPGGNESPQNVTIDSAQLNTLLGGFHPDYDGRTIPIKLSSGNMTQSVIDGNADIVIVSDLSESMRWRMGFDTNDTGVLRGCDDSSILDDDTRRVSISKCLSIDLINPVMNYTGNSVALVSFDDEAEADGGSSYGLTDLQENDSLIAHIESYTNVPSGDSCVCCGLNLAYNILDSQSVAGRDRFVILMSDGIPNRECGGCYYEPGEVIFSTGFEDYTEVQKWNINTTRTTANPTNVFYNLSDAGSIGSHFENNYFGIWGDHLSKEVALDREPIDLSTYTNVTLKFWYSYEDTEAEDKIGMYYWDSGSWIEIFRINDPAIGDGNQLDWTYVETSIPDSINDLYLEFWGRTSGDTETIMIDDLILTVPGNGSCGSTFGECSDTTGASSCVGESSDCSNQNCEPAIADAISASKRLQTDLSANIMTIGFGESVDGCLAAEDSLDLIADCGNGNSCFGEDGATSNVCFDNHAYEIINSTLINQTSYYGGGMHPGLLMPESNIEFRYIPTNTSMYGKVTLTRFTDPINDVATCRGNLTVDENIELASVRLSSYSGEHWGDRVEVSNSGGSTEVFKLWHFGQDLNYSTFGDPFIIDIPVSYVRSGEENIIIGDTGDGQYARTSCSEDNRIIYTMILQSLVGYGDVYPESQGCSWVIQFSDGSNLTNELIPTNYNGTGFCTYIPGNITYDNEDAIDDAVLRLLKHLDVEDDGMVDVIFDPSNVDFDLSRAGGVQSLWGPVRFNLVVWM